MYCTARVIWSAPAAARMRHWRREPPCSLKATIYRGISALLRPRRLEHRAGRAPWARAGLDPVTGHMAFGHALLTLEADPVHRDRPPRRQGAHGAMAAPSVSLQGGIRAREYPWHTPLTREQGSMPEPEQGSARPTASRHSPPLSAAVTRYSHACPRAGN